MRRPTSAHTSHIHTHVRAGDLIGTIKEFFVRVGVTKIKFKPAYNPYTEPSMEVFAYHEVLVRVTRRVWYVCVRLIYACSQRKWVEIGNR